MDARYRIIMSVVVSVLLLFLVSACSRSAESKQNPVKSDTVVINKSGQESDHNHSKTENDEHKEEYDHEAHDHSMHDQNAPETSHDGQNHPEKEHVNHKSEHEHEEHDHSSHAEEEEVEESIKLSPEESNALGITTKEVQSGAITLDIHLQGEIRLNADRTARIVPRASGVVSEVCRTLGDRVAGGDVLAVIESRDLAETRAVFHGAVKRLELARIIYDREQRLWKQKISSQQEYLDAEKAQTEARIELQMAKEKLIALGISRKHLETLPHDPNEPLAQHELVAPFDGTIVIKEITLGEVLGDDTVVFVVSDLSTVWVDLSVYQKDLPQVKAGQKVLISTGAGGPDIEGTISYVGPLVEDDTRRALARVVLPNNDGLVSPGIFVTARILEKLDGQQFIVLKSALQNMGGNNFVFIETAEGFRPQQVVVGRMDEKHAEILAGISAGEKYVEKGAFDLKSKIIMGGLDSHAGHGH